MKVIIAGIIHRYSDKNIACSGIQLEMVGIGGIYLTRGRSNNSVCMKPPHVSSVYNCGVVANPLQNWEGRNFRMDSNNPQEYKPHTIHPNILQRYQAEFPEIDSPCSSWVCCGREVVIACGHSKWWLSTIKICMSSPCRHAWRQHSAISGVTEFLHFESCRIICRLWNNVACFLFRNDCLLFFLMSKLAMQACYKKTTKPKNKPRRTATEKVTELPEFMLE